MSRATIGGLAVCLVLLLVGLVDYAESRDDYLGLVQSGLGFEAYEQERQIEDDFADRVLLYVLGLGLAAAFITAAALRERPGDRVRIFNNLGIAGVCALVAAALAGIVTSSEGLDLGTAPWLLSPAMLLAALIGRLTAGAPRPAPELREVPWQVWAAIGTTAVVVLATFAFAQSQPPCGGAEYVDTAPTPIALLGLAGLVLGFVCLATRHWISATIAVAVNPVAVVALWAASCAFY